MKIFATALFVLSTMSIGYAEQVNETQPSPQVQAEAKEIPERDPITHRPRLIEPDRPHVSEAPVVVGEGVFQIEAGILPVTARPTGGSLNFSTPTLLRYGLSPESELRLEGDFLNHSDQRLGFGDVSLGLKHVLHDEGPEVAMLYIYKFATGSPAFQSAPEPEVKVLLGFDLGDRTELEVNLGGRSTVDVESNVRFAQATFAVALTQTLVEEKLAIFGEVFGDGPFEPGRGFLMTGQFGFLYRLNEDTMLDVEVFRGLSSSGINWGYGLGISARY